METRFDTLRVRATASEEIAADKADLRVTISGASFFTGNTALQKAREVRQLVTDLGNIGVPERAITLLSVTAETSTSVIGKSSTARYDLRIRCTQLDELADILGTITNQKNTQLTAITWDYPEIAPIQDALLQQSLGRARDKAAVMAQALGITLAGVHTVSETLHDHEAQPQYEGQAMLARSRSLTATDLGMAVSHAKRMSVDVEVAYHIAQTG